MMDGVPWMAAWFFIGVLLLALLAGVIVYLIARGAGRADRSSDALEALRVRFARGEIDRAEYEERLAVLRGNAPPERPRA
jgi:uncharacterized membrane protein